MIFFNGFYRVHRSSDITGVAGKTNRAKVRAGIALCDHTKQWPEVQRDVHPQNTGWQKSTNIYFSTTISCKTNLVFKVSATSTPPILTHPTNLRSVTDTGACDLACRITARGNTDSFLQKFGNGVPIRLVKFGNLINYITRRVGRRWVSVVYPGILFRVGGGLQQIQLRTERTGIWGR